MSYILGEDFTTAKREGSENSCGLPPWSHAQSCMTALTRWPHFIYAVQRLAAWSSVPSSVVRLDSQRAVGRVHRSVVIASRAVSPLSDNTLEYGHK